jgi:hypothetical protein
MGQHDTPLLALAPPQSQQLEELGREHGVAILAPFSLFHSDQHAGAVDIIDLEMRHLGDAQACAIGDPERGLVLDAWRRLEQPGSFLDAEHARQLALIAGEHQGPRQIPPLQRHVEQEAQCRDRAIDRGGADAVLMLRKLVATDIIGRSRVGAPPQKDGKAPDVTHIIVLGVDAQAAHQHVLLHALAERRGGSVGR